MTSDACRWVRPGTVARGSAVQTAANDDCQVVRDPYDSSLRWINVSRTVGQLRRAAPWKGSSRVTGNFHARFLGGRGRVNRSRRPGAALALTQMDNTKMMLIAAAIAAVGVVGGIILYLCNRDTDSQRFKASSDDFAFAGSSHRQEKNILLAIGLNILTPGVGYMYMGRVVLGFLALLLVTAIYLTTPLITIAITWIAYNAIMAIDMFILGSKRNREMQSFSTKKCPQCAETIQREARICRFCRFTFDHDTRAA